MSTTVIANWEVQQKHLEHILPLIIKLSEQSRQEEGNVNYQVFQSVKEPNKFTIIEQYVTEDDFMRHLQSEHYQEIAVQKIQPLLIERTGDLYHDLP